MWSARREKRSASPAHLRSEASGPLSRAGKKSDVKTSNFPPGALGSFSTSPNRQFRSGAPCRLRPGRPDDGVEFFQHRRACDDTQFKIVVGELVNLEFSKVAREVWRQGLYGLAQSENRADRSRRKVGHSAVATDNLSERGQRAIAGAFSAHRDREVAGVVADQRHRQIVQRGDNDSTRFARRARESLLVDDFDVAILRVHMVPPGFASNRNEADLVEPVVLVNRYPKTALDTDSHPSRQLFRNGNERLEAFCRPLTLRGKSEFLQRLRISHEVIRGLAVQPDEEILDGGEDLLQQKGRYESLAYSAICRSLWIRRIQASRRRRGAAVGLADATRPRCRTDRGETSDIPAASSVQIAAKLCAECRTFVGRAVVPDDLVQHVPCSPGTTPSAISDERWSRRSSLVRIGNAGSKAQPRAKNSPLCGHWPSPGSQTRSRATRRRAAFAGEGVPSIGVARSVHRRLWSWENREVRYLAPTIRKTSVNVSLWRAVGILIPVCLPQGESISWYTFP